MANPYTRVNFWGARLRQLGLTGLLLGGATLAAQAQTLTYVPASTINVAGTYTDLGTTGTTIATANTDDANSAAIDIGFTFAYNGSNFTQFVFNTNGVIRLGSAAPSTAALYYDNNSAGTSTDPLVSTSAANTNLLMPLNIDLVPGTGTGGADYRVLTSGTAPNRVCTIQWRNVADKAGAGSDVANGTQYDNISFQIKLYETTSVIEFVYDAAVAGSGAGGTRFPNVGLKGSGLAAGQLALGVKATTAAWNTTTFQSTNYGSVAHNITKSVGPDAGRTYRFAPYITPPNDITVRTVYAMGKVITGITPAQVLSVNLANLGTAAQTNVAVTLTISGANTYTETRTIPSFGVGAAGNISFTALPATLNVGTNTVTVSVPADGNNTNNSVSVGQLVTTDRLSYIDPNRATDGSFSGYSNGATVFATKFNVTGTVVPTDAVVSFGAVTAAATAYQVLVYDATGGSGLPGKILYTSPMLSRAAAASTATVTLPALQLTGGTFYIGVREANTTGIAIATQSETPLRPSTFYFSADGNIGWIDMSVSYPRRLAIEVGLAPTPACAAPTALAVTSTTPTTAAVTFTPAASGTSSYQLIYGPVGFQPATGGTTATVTGSPATLTGLQPGANYQLYVRSTCTSGGNSFLTGPVAFSTSCNSVTSISTFPYSESFENVATGLPCGLTILDANADGVTWSINKTAPYAGVNALRYTNPVTNTGAANDWFFTPGLTTAANTRYQVAFRYRGEGIVNSPSNYTEKLEVKVGPTATVAGQTTTLFTNAAITNTNYALANATSAPAVAVFTPGAGTQYVGFHVYSDANQGNLYVDDINITSSVVTATSSEALLRAVTVFPNPSTTGTFDLEIHGVNAKSNLGVLVTNTLGQQVYTGTARDNYTNKLDLSGLAPGLYHLQVRNGDETMTRQIAIVK